MRLIKLNNTIFSYGLIFVCFGMIFSGNAFSVPTIPSYCDDAEDIGDQEDQLLTKQLSYDVDGGDYVDCYKFTVSSGAGLNQLSVELRYDVIDENEDELILKLFSLTSSSVLKSTTIGGGDFNGQQGVETLFWESTDGLLAGETYYMRIDNDTTIPNGYEYKIKWNDNVDTSEPPVITDSSEIPSNGAGDVQAGVSGQSLEVTVSNSTSCSIYYGVVDENSHSVSMIDNDVNSCQVTVPYGDFMTSNGINYWYVVATNAAGNTRYPPTSGNLSFTVSTPDTTSKAMPWLMLLLKGEDSTTTEPTTGKAMPWLMLLL